MSANVSEKIAEKRAELRRQADVTAQEVIRTAAVYDVAARLYVPLGISLR